MDKSGNLFFLISVNHFNMYKMLLVLGYCQNKVIYTEPMIIAASISKLPIQEYCCVRMTGIV